jgi:hypothetical protein
MSKADTIIAIFFASTVLVAIPALAPGARTLEPERSWSGSATGIRDRGVFDRLSMGPDPGGHAGATVTPETTKTGQPSADGPGGTNQSGGSTAAGAVGSETLEQQHDHAGKQPASTTGAAPTSSSPSVRSSKDH